MKTKLHYPSMGGPKRPKLPTSEEETQDYLAEKWDDESDDKFEKVEQLLKEFGTQELTEYLNHSGLGNYAGLIERFYQVVESREKALKSLGDNPMQYDSMAKAEVKSIDMRTRDDLNRAFSAATNEYVEQYGTIDSAPQGDFFIIR